LGLRRSITIWARELIPAQLFCCSVDNHDHNELTFNDTKRTRSNNNNSLLL
jgi:hypothetical protein